MRIRMPGYAPRGRYVKSHEVIFQDLLPLRLKNSVSSKGEQKGGAQCVQEMSVFFACLKKHEFEEKHCGPELASFHKCVTQYEAAKKIASDVANRGALKPGETKLSHHQVTTLLKQFSPK